MRSMFVAFVLVSSLVACNKDGGGAPSGKAAAPATVSIDSLGLKAEVPAGATVGKAIVGDGAMIQGPGLVVTVEAASQSRPKTVEEAKKDADMYTPKNVKEEKLADGWLLTFENTGSLGTNYFVQVRREIGGKAIWCETTAAEPAQSANAVAACKSLKP